MPITLPPGLEDFCAGMAGETGDTSGSVARDAFGPPAPSAVPAEAPSAFELLPPRGFMLHSLAAIRPLTGEMGPS
eukprot:9972187-Alexandrium_andersonii.AAC.1